MLLYVHAHAYSRSKLRPCGYSPHTCAMRTYGFVRMRAMRAGGAAAGGM